jgi:hypothetical protein
MATPTTPTPTPRCSFEDYVWLRMCAEERLETDASRDYWLRCLDSDDDGRVTFADLAHAYQEKVAQASVVTAAAPMLLGSPPARVGRHRGLSRRLTTAGAAAGDAHGEASGSDTGAHALPPVGSVLQLVADLLGTHRRDATAGTGAQAHVSRMQLRRQPGAGATLYEVFVAAPPPRTPTADVPAGAALFE